MVSLIRFVINNCSLKHKVPLFCINLLFLSIAVSCIPVDEGTYPTMSIMSPNSPVSLEVGDSQTFYAEATAGSGIKGIEWYIGSSSQQYTDYTGSWDYYQEESWSTSFDASGTYYVHAYVYDRESLQREAFVTWEVNVSLPDSPTMSIISPSSPVTLSVGESQTFDVEATAASGIKGIEWYIGSSSQQYTDYTGSWDYDQEESWSTSFDASGTYYVHAYVYDRESLQQEAFVTWEVNVGENIGPSIQRAFPENDTVYTRINSSRYFAATATDNDNDLDYVDWYIGSTYQERTAVDSSGGTVSNIFSFSSIGTFTVHAYAFDKAGGSNLTTWEVMVTDSLQVPSSDCVASHFSWSELDFTTEALTMGNSLQTHCGVAIENGVIALTSENNSYITGSTILTEQAYGLGTYTAEVYMPNEPGFLYSFFLYREINGKVYETDFEFIPNDSALWVGTYNDWVEDYGYIDNFPYRHSKKIAISSDIFDSWVKLKIVKSSTSIEFYIDDSLTPIWMTSEVVPTEPQLIMFNVWSPRENEFPNPGAVQTGIVDYKIRNVNFVPEGSTSAAW